jgi:ClpP class serine protease
MDRILELLSARWLIHRETALSYLPLFVAFLNGGVDKLALLNQTEEEKKQSKPKAISFIGLANVVSEWDLNDPNIPENSIAVIPIMGAVVPYKSRQLVETIRQAKANPNINAILFPVNSPGGTVFYTDILSAEIKNIGKPTVAAIMNMSASAAMWMISAMDYRIATSPMDWVGSIGTMVSITDMQVMLKDKLGINIIDIYATKSTRKNEMIRVLREDPTNTQLITEDLDFVNGIFHKAIQDNLCIAADSEVFTGAIYNAEQAITHKLINEINTLDNAIEKAYNLGLIQKAKQQFSQFKPK